MDTKVTTVYSGYQI